MFASIATITNFLVAFIDDTDILVHVLIIFRRLYNFFPKYRKSLEDPMLAIFLSVLKNYKQVADQAKHAGLSEFHKRQL